MRAELGLPSNPKVLQAALNGLVDANLILMQQAKARGQYVPRLYRSGVRYRRERPGSESWDTWDRVYRRGYGDCEDLASWRVAELRMSGQDPKARPKVVRTGARVLHAVVQRGNGRIEDPSQRLGMRRGGLDDGPRLAGELGFMGAPPRPGTTTYRIQRVPGGWLARVKAPAQPALFMRQADRPVPKSTPAPKRKAAKRRSKRASRRRIVRKVGKLVANVAAASGVPGASLVARFL